MIRSLLSSKLFPYTTLFRSSLRIMEERRNLLNEMSNKVQKKGLKKIAEDQRQKAEQLEIHINKLKQILMENEKMTVRSEEHTSELQSQSNLVCRLLLEKKKK